MSYSVKYLQQVIGWPKITIPAIA
uniref:Uncharacterized protein n=1 Tax=Arundo donax TaxID=35708 RepID=A0A0A9HKI3_ARUDO